MDASAVKGEGSIDGRRLGMFLASLSLLAGVVVLLGLLSDLHINELFPIYVFTPAIAAAIVTRQWQMSASRIGLRVGSVRWLGLASIATLPLIGFAILVAGGIPGVTLVPTAQPFPGVPMGRGPIGVIAYIALTIAIGFVVGSFFAFGEEIGWRGYLLWELAPLGFWRASGVIGVAWGVWYAPIVIGSDLFPVFPIVGAIMMLLFCVLISPIFSYLAIRARSVLAAVFGHAVFFGAAGSLSIFTRAEGHVLDQLVANIFGVAGIVTVVTAAIVISILGPPEISRHSFES